MDFKDILIQLERPYWSPVHPEKYRALTKLRSGQVVNTGWGWAYPHDIGFFNLIWLLSGVGLPPADYKRYAPLCMDIYAIQHDTLGRFTLKDTAARYTIDEFFWRIEFAGNPRHASILAALRLKV